MMWQILLLMIAIAAAERVQFEYHPHQRELSSRSMRFSAGDKNYFYYLEPMADVNCSYRGYSPPSYEYPTAVFTLCGEGVEGLLNIEGEAYTIFQTHEGGHNISKLSEVLAQDLGEGATCGTIVPPEQGRDLAEYESTKILVGTDVPPGDPPRKLSLPPEDEGATITTRYVNLVLVNDPLRRARFSTPAALAASTNAIAAQAKFYYESFLTGKYSVEVIIEGVVNLEGEYEWMKYSESSYVVQTFNKWASVQPWKRPGNLAVLLTGRDFDGSVIGIAYLGTVCRGSFQAGAVQATFSTEATNAKIMAHEVGHSIGLFHSTTVFPDTPIDSAKVSECTRDVGEMMQPFLYGGSFSWSECTRMMFDWFNDGYPAGCKGYSDCVRLPSYTEGCFLKPGGKVTPRPTSATSRPTTSKPTTSKPTTSTPTTSASPTTQPTSSSPAPSVTPSERPTKKVTKRPTRRRRRRYSCRPTKKPTPGPTHDSKVQECIDACLEYEY